MKSLYRIGLALTLAAALAGCKSDREKLVESRLDFHTLYEEQIERSVTLISSLRQNVPKDRVRETIKKHRTFEQGRQDLLELYSEKNFTDAEFTQIMDARQRALAGQEPSAEQKPAAEKLARIIQERMKDGTYLAKGKTSQEAILAELDE